MMGCKKSLSSLQSNKLKTIIVMAVGLLSFTNVMAVPTEQCVANHFITAKLSPGFAYEKDQEIVRLWCQCKWQQEQKGKSESEQLEFCFANTNDAIGKHLKVGPHSK